MALVTFRSRQGIVKTQGQVEIAPGATARADLPLLALLGWYLLILFAQDAASAGSTAAIIAATG